MKYFTSFLFLLFSQYAMTQNCDAPRYQERVFENINVTSDIIFGQVNPYDANESAALEDIHLDFYEPVGDNLTKRPLVVMCFGGAFLFGQKEDNDIQSWCDSLAHRGYACAAINYRTGFNTFAERSAVRAVYRAMQDLRAAIRYLEEDPDNMGFNVDPDHVFVGGQSAGAITAIHVAFLDEESERPIETYAATFPPLPGDNSDMGCLDCSGNNYVQPVQIKGIIGMWGAVNELEYITADENVPMLMVHGSLDPVVPYGTGRPFNSPFFPEVHGSSLMTLKLTELDIYNEFYPYPGDASHTVYGAPNVSFPNETWSPIFQHTQLFLYKIMTSDSPMPSGITTVSGGTMMNYQVPNEPTSTYCWSVTGGQIINDNGHEIDVLWGSNETEGTVEVVEITAIDLHKKSSMLTVAIDNSTLALELLDFKAAIIQEQIVLHWQSRSDEEGQGFVLEKSNDGIGFYPLAAMENKGAANTIQAYEFTDEKPQNGLNYYRLKLQHRSGNFSYSEVIGLDFSLDQWLLPTIYTQHHQVFFEVKTTEEEAVEAEIYNVAGQLLWSKKLNMVTGEYLISVEAMGWIRGVYVLKLNNDHHQITRKFVF